MFRSSLRSTRSTIKSAGLRESLFQARFNSTSTPIKQENKKSNENKESKGSSILANAALLSIGALLGAGYVSYKLGANPPEFLFPQSSTLKLEDTISPVYGESAPLIKELTTILGESKVSTTASTLNDHSDSYWSTDHPFPNERPDAVFFPESTEEVSLILQKCHQHKVPVVPYTGGTSLEGHYIPTRRGICIDLTRLNKIVSLHKEDLDIVVQPAIGWEDLRDYLDDYNLMFGPDPGPGACIGGMIGTSCSGTNAARYGTMRENVVSVTVVLADGTIVKTKRRPRKSSAGYNLTNLFVGSEGTLGIVTEATLKLNVKPKFENVAVVSFDSLKDAAGTVAKFVQEGIQLNALELLDDNMMHFVNFSGETTQKYDEAPTLMLKLGGNSKELVHELTEVVKKICKENNNKSFKFAENDEEKFELWNARKVALWSTIEYGKAKIDPNIQVWTTDVAVPISKFVDSLEATKREIEANGITASIVGHAGDGNYHALILFKKEDRPKVAKVVQGMVDRAIALDGTVTGEHGVGIGKRKFLLEELGEAPVDLMRKIKFAVDPNRILNPDKIFSIDKDEPRPDL